MPSLYRAVNMQLPSSHDLEDFLDNVSEVSRLIDGLKAGTVTPEYVDSKLDSKLAAKQQEKAPDKQHVPHSKQTVSVQHDDVSEDARAREAAKQADLQRKVQELKDNRERKLRARQKYEEYTQEQGQEHSFATDYTKWDLWCPSDEEDELFNSMTPNTSAFKAMEKDINDRHNRCVY